MKNRFQKILSAALACCMLAGVIPSSAYATEGEPLPPVNTQAPSVADTPTATQAPAVEIQAPVPTETPSMVVLEEPTATATPTATAEPAETPALEDTAAPIETEVPEVSVKPTETAAENTAEPTAAIEVENTVVPDETAVPVEETAIPTEEPTQVPEVEAGPVEAPGVGYIENDTLYITCEMVALAELPVAAAYSKIVIKEEAQADFTTLEVPLPVIIDEKGVLLNGVFLSAVANNGIIANGVFREVVSNGAKGIILGGVFDKEIGAIVPAEVDFATQFIYGGGVIARQIPADWIPASNVTFESIEFSDEGIYEFGISSDAAASAPEATGVEFSGLTAETAYTVFARIAAIDGDWVKLDAAVSTAAAAEAAPAAFMAFRLATQDETSYYIDVDLVPEAPGVGQTVRAVVDTNLPDDAPLRFSWYSKKNLVDVMGETAFIKAGIDDSYTTTSADVGSGIGVKVFWEADDSVCGEAMTQAVHADILPEAPEIAFDYEKEQFSFTMKEASKGDFSPRIDNETNFDSVTYVPESEKTNYVFHLSDFAMDEGKNTFAAMLSDSIGSVVYGNRIILERTWLTAEEIAAAGVVVSGQSAACADGYELRLVDDAGNAHDQVNGQFRGLSSGVNYTLQLRKSGSNEGKYLASYWTDLKETIVANVPDVGLVICDAANPDAACIETKVGNALQARAFVLQEGYTLPADVVFSWHRVDDNGNEKVVATGEHYTVSEEDAECRLYLTLTSASEGWTIDGRIATVIVKRESVRVSVDYEAETVSVSLNEAGNWNSWIAMDNTVYASGTNVIAAPLNRLLKDNENTQAEVRYAFTNAANGESISGSFSLKARPEFDGGNVAVSVGTIAENSVQLGCGDPAYQPGLKQEDSGAYAWADENGQVGDLMPGANYQVVLRRKGSNAGGYFASKAGSANVEGGGLLVSTLKDFHVSVQVMESDANGVPSAYMANTFQSETEAGKVSFSWYAVDMAGNESLLAEMGSEAKFILTEGSKESLFFKQVKVVARDSVSNKTATAYCGVYHTASLGGDIDYEKESLIITAPMAVTADCVLHVNHKAYAWADGAQKLEIALKDFGLPSAAEAKLDFALMHETSGTATPWTSCNVPARPAADVASVAVYVDGRNISVSGIPAGYRVGTAQSGSAIEDVFAVENGQASGVIRNQGQACYVMADIPSSNAEKHFASETRTIKRIPASISFALKRQNSEGEIAALRDGVYADPGELLLVELGGAYENIRYRWFRNGVEIAGETGAFYQTGLEDLNAVVSVELVQAGDAGENTAVASASIAGIVFEVKPDFKRESLVFTAPLALSGGWFLKAGESVKWPDGEASAAFFLKDMGISIEGSGENVSFRVLFGNPKQPSAGLQTITLPNRSEYTGLDAVVKEKQANSIVLEAMDGVEFGLSPVGADAPYDIADGDCTFTSLIAGLEYQLWMRNAATDTVFASKWKAAGNTVCTTLVPLAGKPEAQIDFLNEKLMVTAPEQFATEDLPNWTAVLDPEDVRLGKGFKSGERTTSMTLKLIELPSSKKDIPAYVYLEKGSEQNGTRQQSEFAPVTVPKRPAFSGDVSQITVKQEEVGAKSMRFSCTPGYEVVLKKNGYIYSYGTNSFTGLEYGTEYEVYVCNAATETSFASEPAALGAIAGTLPFSLAVDKANLVPGETVTATLTSGGMNYPDLIYTWYSMGSDGMKIVATGAYRNKYTATAADVGRTLLVEVHSESAKLSTWISAAEVKLPATPTPVPTATMPVASDEPLNPTASATVKPTPAPTPTATVDGYGGNWGTSDGVLGFYGEPEADGQGYDSSERLYDDYLVADYGWDSILFDAEGEPVDYELLPVYRDLAFGTAGEANENTLLVVAQPDMEGLIAPRALRFYLSQLDHLNGKKEMDTLVFRNGDADAYLNLEEVLTGDIAKLARLVLDSQVMQLDALDIDFESMEEVQLSLSELSDVYLEVRISPVELDEESYAWDISVWLCTDSGAECEISNLLYEFYVCLNVNGMFEVEQKDDFAQTHTVALIDMEADMEEEILLDSELIFLPAEMPGSLEDEAEYFSVIMPYDGVEYIDTYYEPAMPVDFYRNYALAAYYAGPGAYLVSEIEDEF